MAAAPGGLQEEALKRKERLKALRARTGAAAKQNKGDGEPEVKLFRGDTEEEEEEVAKHKSHASNLFPPAEEGKIFVVCNGQACFFRFYDKRELRLRNYAPEDEVLKTRVVPQGQPASVEDKVKDQLEAAKPEPIIEEVDLANLAPRKPDWDLKRDVAKKLEKLEKRTQKAIAELIRERLRGQEENLASAVDSAKQEASDSD